MAYDRDLAERIRGALAGQPGLAEKAMFGGLGFLLRGNMCCGVLKDDLMVRVGPDLHAEALARPGARPFDMTGRPAKGWVVVSGAGVASAGALEKWVEDGVRYALLLPPK